MSMHRPITLAGLGLLMGFAWWSLVAWPMPMPDERGVATASYAALTTVMWLVMMIAMMAPSVTPVVLLHARVSRQTGAPVARTAAFVGGYFTAWLTFSILVSLLQILLISQNWIDTMGVARSAAMNAVLLVAAGVYQWLPIKTACLVHCRSPVEFLTRHYRPGLFGAWSMGAGHGLYCVGCCWVLMILLFVGGVMNLAWVAGISALILLEKVGPRGEYLARIIGALLAAAGMWILARAPW